MSCFDVPAYKLTIKDLSEAEDVSAEGVGDWKFTLHSNSLKTNSGKSGKKDPSTSSVDGGGDGSNYPEKEVILNLAMVWIQGSVVGIVDEQDDGTPATLHISDGTADAYIYDYAALPGADHPLLVKGAYVGALGQIWSTKPQVVMKGAKLMCLQDKPNVKALWPDEVRLAKAFLLGIIEPDLDLSTPI